MAENSKPYRHHTLYVCFQNVFFEAYIHCAFFMCQSFDRADEVWTKSPIAIGWLSVGSNLWMLIHTHTYIALAKKNEKHTDIIHCMYVAILYACCRIHTVYVCFFERLHTYIVCMKF